MLFRSRYVFDIADAMLDKQHNLRHKEIKRLKLAQFKPKTLRLVIENDTSLKPVFDIENNEIIDISENPSWEDFIAKEPKPVEVLDG